MSFAKTLRTMRSAVFEVSRGVVYGLGQPLVLNSDRPVTRSGIRDGLGFRLRELRLV